MRHCRLIIIALIALLAAPLPGRAASDPTVAEFIAYVDQSMRAAAREGGDAGTRCRSLINRVMDIDYMAHSAIGEAWNRMTRAQRSSFRAGFERKMSAHCLGSLNDFAGQSMTLIGSRAKGDEQLAGTRMTGGGGQVTWRLRKGGSHGWRAVDVIKDGRSALISAREEYAAILSSNQGNVDALISYLQR